MSTTPAVDSCTGANDQSTQTIHPTSATKSPLAMKVLLERRITDCGAHTWVTTPCNFPSLWTQCEENWGEKSCLFASQYLFLAATKAYEEYNKPSGQVRIEKQRLHDRLKINFDADSNDNEVAAVDSDIGAANTDGIDRPDERALWLMNNAQGGDANAMVYT